MKKTLLLLASAVLLFAGCAKEQIAGGEADANEVTVTFTAGLTPEGTKAVIDQDGAAKKVNHWIMRVYDAEGALFIEDERDVTAGSDAALVQTFELKLFKNQTYDLLFWADTKGAYNTGDLTAVSKSGLTANADSFDAFSAHVSYQSLSSEAKNVTLTRPFAQLNIITNDLAALKAKVKADAYSKYAPSDFQLLATVPTTFNVKTQTAGTATEQTLTATASYGSFAEPDPAGTTLFMDYIFASKDEADVLDLAFSFKSNLQEISYDFTAIPLQRNYRTNIKGQLMSNNSDWTVTIDPDWDSQADGSDDYNVVYYQASSIEAANSYIGSQNEEQTKTVDLTNAEVKSTDVNADGTIHFILKTTSPADEVSFMLPEIPSDLAAAGCTGWTIEYEEGYPTKNVNVSAPANTNVIILAPTSHVLLNGETYEEIDALTGYGTLVVPQGVVIKDLTVKKGWVEIHGTVNTLQVTPVAGECVYFCACEGLSQTVFDKIKGEDFSYIHPSYVERQNGTKWDIVLSENPGDGSRKISLAGSPFKAGDVIKISNGVAEPVDCTVEEDEQGNILIKTNLMGSLTAVYPASAAKLNGNVIEGANIPATQSGKLADARIYKATISAGSTKATFESQTSILKFYVDETIGVKSVSVTSAEDLASGGAKTITVDPSGEQTIDNVTDDPAKRICYAAVLPGEKSSLTYSSATTTQGSVSRTLSSGATLAAGQEYEAFIPYYIDLGTAGLWGYCNVGAFLPEEYGRYFGWADVTGQTWNGAEWSNGGFTTAPEFDGQKGTLPLAKDAANVAWGGKWILPTEDQLNALTALEEELVWNGEKKGYVVSDKLFLPAAGAGSGIEFESSGEIGAFWSSSYGQYTTQQQQTTGYYALQFYADYYITGTYNKRAFGMSARPVMASGLTGISLNKETIPELEVGDSETLTCTLTPTYAAVKSISWTSNDESVATVSENGEVNGVAAGTATIKVTVKDLYNTEKTATCSVTVIEPYHPVTGLSLDFESATILKGKTKTLSATATPENATEKGVTWTSSNESVATVSDAGVVTAVSTGSATITATSKDNAQKTATCSVTVKELPAGALSGAFSVSDTKQVYFAKGNLWYNANNSTFNFEDTQYAAQESLNKSHQDIFRNATTIAQATTILIPGQNIKLGDDVTTFEIESGILFTNDQSNAEKAKSDFTVGGVKGKYRALSGDEWTYLLGSSDKRSGKLCKFVQIDNTYKGFLIAPDDYTGELPSYETSYNISIEQWEEYENAGLVFISLANYYWFGLGVDNNTHKITWLPDADFQHAQNAFYLGSDSSCLCYYQGRWYSETDKPYLCPASNYGTFNPAFAIRLVTEL